MQAEQIRALYDREQRRDVEYPGTRREITPEVVRHISLTGREPSMIMYSCLTAGNADAIIEREVAHFEGLGLDFEWKVYSHDEPADLKDRLAAYGFEAEDAEAILVLDITAAPAALLGAVPAEVQRLAGPEQVDEVVKVLTAVWQVDHSALGERLAEDLLEPGRLSVYVARVGGQPASVAWIYYHPDNSFASLWGGSTLPDYRQRGLYSALLAARLQEARQRGVRFLTVDASPMSRPILEKHGFGLITYAHPRQWRQRSER